MAELNIDLFGHFTVYLDGDPITAFRSDKARALLAYLVLHLGQPHSRNTIAGFLWPDVPDKQARQSLRSTLYNLRKTLFANLETDISDTLLEVTAQTIQLNADSAVSLTVDVTAFQTLLATCESHDHESLSQCQSCLVYLKQAADLYQNEFLAGFSLRGASEFEAWILLQREVLHQRALLAVKTLADIYENRRDDEQAFTYATRLVSLDPYREASHRQMMRLLTYRNLPNQALTQYATCRQLLMDELDTEPEAETVILAEQIRRGEFGNVSVAYNIAAPPVEISPPSTTANKKGLAGGEAYNLDTASGSAESAILKRTPYHDWHEMPIAGPFFGRETEIAQLETWLVTYRCRLVSILGIGGMGKTSLAAQVVPALTDYFDLVIWRSLLNAPPLTELVSTILPALSNQQVTSLPDKLTQQLQLFFDYLKDQRVLLVLDNLESIMQADTAGQYRAGYEEYGQLLSGMMAQHHQGQLLLTSREQPFEVRRLKRDTSQVQSLQLAGLDGKAGEQLLINRGLSGHSGDEAALIKRYSGNPLALKLVADTVHDLFFGNIEDFLAGDSLIFDDVRHMLDQHFVRLTALEQEILFWLAIEREPINVPALRKILHPPPVNRTLLEALNSLQRRSLIERQSNGFSLQNVITEFLTDRLVEGAIDELQAGSLNLLNRYPLIKAQSKAYVCQSQRRLILEPVGKHLTALHNPMVLQKMIQTALDTLRHSDVALTSYAGGNLLNLALSLDLNLIGLDFSHLAVWQVDARHETIQNVNFANADLSHSHFTDTFAALSSIAFHPTMAIVAVACLSEIRFWNTDSGQPLDTLQGHKNFIWSIAYDSQGHLLVSGGEDGTVRLWDVQATGRPTVSRVLYRSSTTVRAVSFSPDDSLIAAVMDDNKIRIWRTENLALVASLQTYDGVNKSLVFSPNGRLLVACSRSVRLWHIDHLYQREDISTFVKHPSQAVTDKQKINSDQFMQVLWHAQKDEGALRSLAFSRDGALLASGSDSGTAFLWKMGKYYLDSNNPPQVEPTQISAIHNSRITHLCFGPDRQMLVTADDDGLVRTLDIESGQVVKTLSGHRGAVTGLAHHLDKAIIATGSTDGTFRLWNVSNGKMLFLTSGQRLGQESVAFSPTDPLFATSGEDKKIRIWSIELEDSSHAQNKAQRNRAVTVRCQHIFSGHSDNIWSMGFSPDGRFLASGGGDNTMRLWDIKRGQRQITLTEHRDFVRAVSFAPFDKTLASGCFDGVTRLWDSETAQYLGCLVEPTKTGNRQVAVRSLAYSPDGKLLATGLADGSVTLWNVVEKRIQDKLLLHTDWVYGLVFSADGEFLASCGGDGIISLWSLEKQACIVQWAGHEDRIRAITFSIDQSHLITCSEDSTTRHWLIPTGEQFDNDKAIRSAALVQHEHTNSVIGIATASAYNLYVTTSHDGTFRIWDGTTNECLKVARAPGPYEGMNISGVTGINEAQRAALKALGAIEAG